MDHLFGERVWPFPKSVIVRGDDYSTLIRFFQKQTNGWFFEVRAVMTSNYTRIRLFMPEICCNGAWLADDASVLPARR